MNPRDDLYDLIDDAIGHAGRDNIALTDHIHDAIRAAGYVKADGEEWGVQCAPRFGSTISEMHTKGEAESCVRQWPGSTLVRRSVGYGPWEVA